MLHDVALLYLALAHGTDMDIDPSEQVTMVERLKTWDPDAGAWRLRQILQEVMFAYLGEHSRHMVDAAMASIKASMSKDERVGVLNDLADLAVADGTLVPGEVAFIREIASFWEVEDELQ